MADETNMVPQSRLNEVVAEKNAANSALAAAEAKLSAAEAASTAHLAAKDTALASLASAQATLLASEADLTSARAGFGIDLSLAEAGLDAEARDVAKLLHERTPEADRPALADWVQGFRADPSTAPRALRGYLATTTATETTATTATTTTTGETKALPRTGAHVKAGDGEALEYSAAAIRGLRERFKVGDLTREELQAHMENARKSFKA